MRSLALVASLTVVACGSQHSSGSGTRQALLRTPPVATCTADQQKACPAMQALACQAGQEPVIDYSSDCCAHVTCQPSCSAPASRDTAPAPACPVGTHLWIGTAVEDCCPAFRCDPDGATCDPSKATACTLAIPTCAGGAPPVVVGRSSDCCPIYQCGCGLASGPSAAPNEPAPVALPADCGCTRPTCKPGDITVCAGTDPCGGPCTCQPQQPQCTTDADCPAGERCDAICVGWGCATAGGTTAGGAAGGSAATGCTCPPNDTTCSCDPAGNCSGQTCTRQCVPASPTCDPAKPPPCPMSLPACPGGTQPVAAGTDPTTCCPTYKCSVCPMTATAIACPMMPVCKCATQVGINPSTCCPSYVCGDVDPATGSCL